LIFVSVLIGSLLPTVAAYGGLTLSYQDSLYVATFISILGFLILLTGIVYIVLPQGMQRDSLWIFKTGPFIK
jgi:hypothetical protein